MSNSNTQDMFERLVAVLKLERASLLEGKLDAVEAVKPQRDHLVNQLSHSMADLGMSDLRVLQSLSRDNNSLYESALEGLGAAKARVEGWLEAESGLTTYTSDRSNVCSDHTGNSYEKRA